MKRQTGGLSYKDNIFDKENHTFVYTTTTTVKNYFKWLVIEIKFLFPGFY